MRERILDRSYDASFPSWRWHRPQEPTSPGRIQLNHEAHRQSTPLNVGGYLKMFTARAVTSRMLTADTADSESISSFAQGLSGIESVGLKAMELVNET